MRLLFASFGSPGFLFPTLGIASELMRRGHHVAFASGAESTGFLSGAGIERIPRPKTDGRSFAVATWGVPESILIDLRHLEHALQEFRPDAIVTHQLCISALIAREKHRLPLAVVGQSVYLWPPARFPAYRDCDFSPEWQIDETQRVLNRARSACGLPALTDRNEALATLVAELFMVRTVAELEPDLEHLPAPVHAIGACEWEPPDDGAWEDEEPDTRGDSPPLVYVHEGRTFNQQSFWPCLVEALGGTSIRVAASTGRMDLRLGELPSNFVTREHLPQGKILRHARAVLASGHSSVVLGALARGIPSVLIPGGGETPATATRVAAAGCAIRLHRESLTAKSLRAAIDECLSNESLRENAARLHGAFDRVDGIAVGATLVESLRAFGSAVSRVN
jgi:MGT family glycosyltransferase